MNNFNCYKIWQRLFDDELWLEALPFWSIHELEREARRKTARELERHDGGIYFRMGHTKDERFMRGEFQLHPEDGAVVLQDQQAHSLGQDGAQAARVPDLAAGDEQAHAVNLLSFSDSQRRATREPPIRDRPTRAQPIRAPPTGEPTPASPPGT